MILLLAGDIAFSSVLLHPSRPSSIAILCLRLSLPSNARCICGLLFRIDNAISATFSESRIKRRYQPRTRAEGSTWSNGFCRSNKLDNRVALRSFTKKAAETSNSKGRRLFLAAIDSHSRSARRTSGKIRYMTVTSATVDIGSEVDGFRQYRRPLARARAYTSLVVGEDARVRSVLLFPPLFFIRFSCLAKLDIYGTFPHGPL